MSDDKPTVCVTHGAFIPCRKNGEHTYTDNPFWVKSVSDYQGSDIVGLTWEPAYLARPKHEARPAHPDTQIEGGHVRRRPSR